MRLLDVTMSTILAACYLFGLASGFVADLSLLAFAGTPVGQVINFNGRKLLMQHTTSWLPS